MRPFCDGRIQHASRPDCLSNAILFHVRTCRILYPSTLLHIHTIQFNTRATQNYSALECCDFVYCVTLIGRKARECVMFEFWWLRISRWHDPDEGVVNCYTRIECKHTLTFSLGHANKKWMTKWCFGFAVDVIGDEAMCLMCFSHVASRLVRIFFD